MLGTGEGEQNADPATVPRVSSRIGVLPGSGGDSSAAESCQRGMVSSETSLKVPVSGGGTHLLYVNEASACFAPEQHREPNPTTK